MLTALFIIALIVVWYVYCCTVDFNNKRSKSNGDIDLSHCVTKLTWRPDNDNSMVIKEPGTDRRIYLENKYGNLTIEEIVFNKEIAHNDKVVLLSRIYGYTYEEAEELLETSIRAEKKAKLTEIKRKISKKAQELYGNIPVDDDRKPISDEVKMYVWQRDGGKCVKCGSKESLEYDHIIPFSKGGSSTERNIQLLCEKCNRSKRDDII
ncbi:MAG: HNH endonuclease [Candidatus Omnitrophota bacterium]|jgi:hypothetical protein